MRKWNWLSFGYLLIWFFPLLLLGNSNLEKYEPEVLVQARVGPKENEFGLIEGDEMEALGAAFFTVSPYGEIYIYDKAKNNIKQFSKTGEFVKIISLGGIHPYDMIVDPDGKIYLLYDRGYPKEERYFIYQLSPEGTVQATIKVLDIPEIGYHRTGGIFDNTPVLGMVSLYFVNRDLYLYDYINAKSLPLIKNGKILENSQIKKGIFEGRLTVTGSKWGLNIQGGIDLYKEKGKPPKRIFPEQRVLIDVDDHGNYYFYEDNGDKREKGMRKIFKFNQEGNLKAEIKRTVHHYTARIKNRGDIVITSEAIYTLNVYREKVEVIKYSLISETEKGGLEK